MTINNEELVKIADNAQTKAFEMISQIANLRLEFLANEFRSTFPKRSLKIIFGNGDELVSVNGHQLGVYGTGISGTDSETSMTWDKTWADKRITAQLNFVAQAIRDVWAITDHYRRGCPDDLEVLPDDSELQGGPDVENEIITIRKAVGSDIRDYGEHPAYDCPRPGSPGDAVHIQ